MKNLKLLHGRVFDVILLAQPIYLNYFYFYPQAGPDETYDMSNTNYSNLTYIYWFFDGSLEYLKLYQVFTISSRNSISTILTLQNKERYKKPDNHHLKSLALVRTIFKQSFM